jgi:hypothetical protein
MREGRASNHITVCTRPCPAAACASKAEGPSRTILEMHGWSHNHRGIVLWHARQSSAATFRRGRPTCAKWWRG